MNINVPKCNKLLCLLTLILFIVSSYLMYIHVTGRNKIYEESKLLFQKSTKDAAEKINSILLQAMSVAEFTANDLSSGAINKKNMLDHIKMMLTENNNFFGASITFRPYGYAKDMKLYSVYYSKSGKDGALEFLRVDQVYDYTKPDYDWYVEPMMKGNRWGEPYWDEAGKTYMTTYSALFYKQNSSTGEKEPNGVVTVDISMNQIKNIVESLDIGPSGFGALTTQEGNYLYHPDYDYVLSHKNLNDIAREKNDSDRILLAAKVAKKEGGIIDHVSTTTGQASWLIFESVPISGWSLQNTFIKNDITVDLDAMRREMIWIIIISSLFFIFLFAFILNVVSGQLVRVWIFVGGVSIVLAICIGIIWNLALNYKSLNNGHGVKLTNKETLKTLMSAYQRRTQEKHLAPLIYIPTGIHIDTMEFKGSNSMFLTGRVWQKYPENFPPDIKKGFQIGQGRNNKISRIESHQRGKDEVIQWYFETEMQVHIDYSRYPLEAEHIKLHIKPWETHDNIVLVPDLDAYKLIAPTLLPGLSENVFIPGWEFTDTFFLWEKKNSKTDFGVEHNFDQEKFPDLYYEIGMNRIFVDAFISNLTPLIVVTIILFAVTLLPSNIDISRILGICVSVFFVVVFSHLAIRKNISIGKIFYLEYFFFVIYLTILFVPVKAFRVILNIKSRIFDYQDGLILSIIFWPSILGIFLIITAWKFY